MFNFFKVVRLNKNLNHNSKIISHCSSSAHKVFCRIDDEVQIFWKDWECITLRMKNLKLCCMPDNSDYLVLLSQQTVENKIFLKVYNVSTQLNHKMATLIGNCVLESNNKATALSALICDSQLLLCIGLDNGNIYFYKSTLQKDVLANAFKYCKVTTKPIKGIKFSKNKESVNMFVCSDAGIYCYTISNISRVCENKLILDDMKSSIHCITLKPSWESPGEQYLVVARDDGLYCYTAEGRGPCYAISGLKQAIDWFGKQLIIVMKTKTSLPFHQATSQVVIYDIDNKIIVLNKHFDEVACVLPISGNSNCIIFLRNGDMFTLKEQELKYKLSHLIKKNLYEIALKFLEEYKTNIEVVSNILVQYGDYLLQRGDSSGAIIVYSKTIGITPPFLIIKRLMDFRYNEFLIQYLSKLVQTNFKIPEHIELLNNCFRRINLPKSAFSVFDIEGKCKQLYVDHVSINYNENMTLIMNDLKRKEDYSLNLVREYSNGEIIRFLSEYGYYLIKEDPNKLKELSKHLLSDHLLKNNTVNKILLPLSLMNKQCALHFIDNLIKDCEKDSIYNIITELILQMWYRGYIDTEFVIDFFYSHQPEKCMDNIFVLCRHYKFWPAIKMIYDKCSMEVLSTHCLAKCCETFPEYITSEDYSGRKLNQMFQVLKKTSIANNYSSKYVTYIIKNIINSNPYYILNTLNGIVTCSDFLLSQLDEFVVQEHFLTYFKCDDLYRTVSFLENRVISMEEVMHNYLERPIEFRNRSCDICKQLIKLPSIFFLCQHSFHRECFIQFSENFVCIVCTDIHKIKNSEYGNINKTVNDCKNTILVEISNKIGQLAFKCNDNTKNKTMKNNSIVLKEYENLQESNPFENERIFSCVTYNEYDDNLNPFNNK